LSVVYNSIDMSRYRDVQDFYLIIETL